MVNPKRNSRAVLARRRRLIRQLELLRRPHQAWAAAEAIIEMVDERIPAGLDNLPMHAMPPRNVSKLTEAHRHLEAALRLIREVTAEETPRVRVVNGNVYETRSERQHLRRRDALRNELLLVQELCGDA
jgi:hypothetical protein